MEFPPEMQGEKIVCPHCHQLTFLGTPKPQPPPVPQIHPASYDHLKKTGSVKTKTESLGSGCLVQGIGLCVIWIWPFGTVIGLVLLAGGSIMARKRICSECGNPISNRQVKLCPHCGVILQ